MSGTARGLTDLFAQSNAWSKGPTMASHTPGSQPDAGRSLRTFIERSAETTVVRIGGELDIATESEVHALLRRCYGAVVLDLAQVTLLDACSIGALVRERQRLTEEGGMLMLRAPAPLIRRVLGILGLADWIVE